MVTLRSALDQNKKWIGYLEAQPRVSFQDTQNLDSGMSALIIRPALGYQVTPHVSIWQGYAWAPTFQPEFRDENRLFQQLLIENKIKKLSLTNRTRLEERFIEDTNGASIRGRHLLRGSYPLGKAQKWSVVAYDEFFVNFNSVSNGPASGFDQNRSFAGINRKLNEHVNVEAGYMFNYVNRREPGLDRINHIILLTLNMNVR